MEGEDILEARQVLLFVGSRGGGLFKTTTPDSRQIVCKHVDSDRRYAIVVKCDNNAKFNKINMRTKRDAIQLLYVICI